MTRGKSIIQATLIESAQGLDKYKIIYAGVEGIFLTSTYPSYGKESHSIKWGNLFAEWWSDKDGVMTTLPVKTIFSKRKNAKFIAAFEEEFGVTIPTRGWSKEN